ncbi:MAG: FecR family protein [Prolixibacteraceae bacterium]|nr:FecR family protein [Prolixibacteraceae bacterium]
MLNSEEEKNQVYTWLEENWEKTEHKGIDIPTEAILSKIHQHITNTVPIARQSTRQKTRIRRIGSAISKYAAVCIVALGIEWFVFGHGNPFAVHSKTTVQADQYHEINVPKGSKSYVVLADSTKVWLNAGARFRYPASFQKDCREVFLEGEAFFDVSKNEEMPFFVNMDGMDIKVLGTRFNVEAYADEKNIEATLVEGVIEVVGLRSDKLNKNNLQLKPGQKLILVKEKSGQENAPVKIKSAELINLNDTKPETAWVEDKMIFYKERFDNVKTKMERWYGVTIDIQNPEILDYRFTGTFDEETFEQALQALKKAARFDYQIHKKHVVIKPN